MRLAVVLAAVVGLVLLLRRRGGTIIPPERWSVVGADGKGYELWTWRDDERVDSV